MAWASPIQGHGRELSASLMCIWPAVLSDAVSLVISRQLLQHFTQEIKLKLPHDAHKEVAT